MARRGPASFAKRQREVAKQEKAQAKREERAARKAEKGQRGDEDIPPGVDPDLIGIKPGPQPPRDE